NRWKTAERPSARGADYRARLGKTTHVGNIVRERHQLYRSATSDTRANARSNDLIRSEKRLATHRAICSIEALPSIRRRMYASIWPSIDTVGTYSGVRFRKALDDHGAQKNVDWRNETFSAGDVARCIDVDHCHM